VRRWPPSAAQTARAVLPHASFHEDTDLDVKKSKHQWTFYIRKFEAASSIPDDE